MDIQRVNDDSMIWKNKGLVSAELQDLFAKIETFDKGVTYEVHLEKIYKSLKTHISRQFAGKMRINVKPKDQILETWYIRVDARPPKKRKTRRITKRRILMDAAAGINDAAAIASGGK